jgi:hypothetical protein
MTILAGEFLDGRDALMFEVDQEFLVLRCDQRRRQATLLPMPDNFRDPTDRPKKAL